MSESLGMERPDEYGLRALDERRARLADEMAQEYVLGHQAVQTARYMALQEALRQTETDRQWAEYSKPAPQKSHLTCG